MNTAAKNARVVDILDAENVVLNVGSDHGVQLGSKFVLFSAGRQVKDLDGNSLGTLEITKGYGKVIHVQPTMCILRSDTYGSAFEAVTTELAGLATFNLKKGEFLKVNRGDFARPV